MDTSFSNLAIKRNLKEFSMRVLGYLMGDLSY
jgi:hypothetical protein